MTELHPRVAEVIEALEQSHRELVDVVMAIPEDRRDAVPTDGRWSVAQNLEHLAVVEDGSGRMISKLIKQIAERGAQETETSSIVPSMDRFQMWRVTRRFEAPDMVQPKEGLSASDALARLTAARVRMIEALRRGSGLALASVTQPHPAIGPLDVYQWGLATAHHERRHIAQIRDVAGLE